MYRDTFAVYASETLEGAAAIHRRAFEKLPDCDDSYSECRRVSRRVAEELARGYVDVDEWLADGAVLPEALYYHRFD